MKICSSVFFVLLSASGFAQDDIRVFPAHWWTGMKERNLQLLVSSELPLAAVHDAGPIKIRKVHQFINKRYTAIDIEIAANAKPGLYELNKNVRFRLKPRTPHKRGISSEDLIYLIMPDRFANGDTSNDRIAGMMDQSLDRSDYFKRHGGDLKGIQDHLDYLQELGVTAVWLNPVLTNNMPDRTEHGYAFTDHYTIDPRLGGAEAYHALVEALHRRGMKIIQDAVYNHVGIEHMLFRQMPDSSWFNWWPAYTNTTYKDQVLLDPYASEEDKRRMSNGWFTSVMPDWNQRNAYVSRFLIQHAIWSTEEFALDGWRIDTYAYNDLAFMNRCNEALLREFPGLHLFGETWMHGIPNQSFFTANKYGIPFKSNLPGVTDFQLNLYGIVPALTQSFGWTEGVNRLYLTATNDFVYKDPYKNVIFLDNHDLSRFYSVVGEDMAKLKMGLAWLLTFRGIPQLYYGTEIGMKNFADPDGLVRLDFIGGWPGDVPNKFLAGGRSPAENEIFQYVKTLANFRKNSSALKTGRMMQYVPEDGVYVYFRYNAQQTIMCIMNPNDQEKELDAKRFVERIRGMTQGRNVADGTVQDVRDKIKAPGKTVLVLALQ